MTEHDKSARQKDDASRRRGHLFIISAPSGAGKTTLCKRLLARFPDLVYSVSHTTRMPRPGETDGVDYHFITRAAFEDRLDKGLWAEWARVHDNYYGTSADQLNQALDAGCDVLLDIDAQGTRQIIGKYPESVTIFIKPPSMDALESRLRNRETDSDTEIAKRLKSAAVEMTHIGMYRHVVVNDDLPDAVDALSAIVTTYRKGE